eukprot:TRINITY_DN22108_c0_g1_i1.p1 TRINITY_DN22108_c0_g1~~TRINITY_DN22108_c0_g1_i1.p1  ORF type:complete len:333 (-),score=63.56 TRINITY_DN22108_c0_g1_i1:59-1057(-)
MVLARSSSNASSAGSAGSYAGSNAGTSSVDSSDGVEFGRRIRSKGRRYSPQVAITLSEYASGSVLIRFRRGPPLVPKHFPKAPLPGDGEASSASSFASDTTTGAREEESRKDLTTFIKSLSVAELKDFLNLNMVRTELFGSGSAARMQDLWLELLLGESAIEWIDPSPAGGVPLIQRHARVLIVELSAVIDGQQRYLVKRSQDNRSAMSQCASRKMFYDETPDEAYDRSLRQNFDGDSAAMRKAINVIERRVERKGRTSVSYPSIWTLYELHTYRAQIVDLSDPCLKIIGLPAGDDFQSDIYDTCFARRRVRRWTWYTSEDYHALRIGQSDS